MSQVGAPVVHIVDDDQPTRTAMARLLGAEGYAVRTHASAADLLAALHPGEPGCIVLDVQMPGLSGLELQAKIAEGDDPLPVIFLTGHGQIPDSVRAIQDGAVDFLTKPAEPALLLAAIARALAKDAADRDAREHRRALRERYERLTPREREVLEHLISGQLNKQAAADLNIAERTIKLHRAQIREKLGTDSMAGLTRIAIELGIRPTDSTK
jgi:FixJ family two-component response regulator